MVVSSKEKIVASLDVLQVLASLGVHVKSSDRVSAQAPCPLHHDTDPSFRVDLEDSGEHKKGHWVCYAGCGHGDIFDLIGRINGIEKFSDQLAWAAKHAGVTIPAGRKAPGEKPIATLEQVHAWCDRLLQDEEAYKWVYMTRGADPKTYLIGLDDGAITIPFIKDLEGGEVQILGVRRVTWPRPKKGPRYTWMKGSKQGLFMASSALGDEVVVVESEFDAMLIAGLGMPAVATCGTSGFRLSKIGPVWTEMNAKKVYAFPDFDEAGRKAAKALYDDCVKQGLSVSFISKPDDCPEGVKDIGDYYQKFGATKTVEWLKSLLDSASAPKIEGWRQLLDVKRNSDGVVTGYKKTLHNLRLIIEHKEPFTRWWYDEMRHRLMDGDKPIADGHCIRARMIIEREFGILYGKDEAWDAIIEVLKTERSRDPLADWLKSLPKWDGTERIVGKFGDYFTLGEDESCELKSIYLKRWMISAVRRALHPGTKVDTMLVLVGAQGLRKSTFANVLGRGFSCEQEIVPGDKDSLILLSKSWIVEMNELDATTRKKDQAALRAFLSRQTDEYRPPYGRVSEEHPRRCVFLGTTNDPQVIKEEDGRRYWPVHVTGIDYEAIQRDRDQLWAEALHYHHLGEPHWLTPAEELKRVTDNKKFIEIDDIVFGIEAVAEGWIRTRQSNFIPTVNLISALKEKGFVCGRRSIRPFAEQAGLKAHRFNYVRGYVIPDGWRGMSIQREIPFQ